MVFVIKKMCVEFLNGHRNWHEGLYSYISLVQINDVNNLISAEKFY